MRFLAAIVACLCLVAFRLAASPAQPPSNSAATFTVDSSEAPDLKDWGDKAKGICETWYPKICDDLATDGFKPPTSVKLVFKRK